MTKMINHRQFRSDVFPQENVYAVGVKIKLNTGCLEATRTRDPRLMRNQNNPADILHLQHQLIEKQNKLLELQQTKRNMELLQRQIKLRESKKNPGSEPNINKSLNPHYGHQPTNTQNIIGSKLHKKVKPPIKTNARKWSATETVEQNIPKRSKSENLGNTGYQTMNIIKQNAPLNKYLPRKKEYHTVNAASTTDHIRLDSQPKLTTANKDFRKGYETVKDVPTTDHMQSGSQPKLSTSINKNMEVTTKGYQTVNATTNHQHTADHPKSSTSSININDLLQKLIASGLVPNNQNINSKETISTPVLQDKSKTIAKRDPLENLKEVTFDQPQSLKIRQHGLYNMLYSGKQCSTCGMRFPTEKNDEYNEHLDWHFRQNRKGRKNVTKQKLSSNRQWYCSTSDWKNYDGIGDYEEREKTNFFEQQATEKADKTDKIEIPVVPSDPKVTNESCHVCKEYFDEFFNEEKEEWSLRNAIRMEGKAFHPVCYDDYLNSLQNNTLESQSSLQEDDDEDDDLYYQHKNDEDCKKSEDQTTKEEEEKKIANLVPEKMALDGDDDVILNEVTPIVILIDDDDD